MIEHRQIILTALPLKSQPSEQLKLFNSHNRIAIASLIFCLRVNFMEHLGVAQSSGKSIPKISIAV